jgi:hypothetical protein
MQSGNLPLEGQVCSVEPESSGDEKHTFIGAWEKRTLDEAQRATIRQGIVEYENLLLEKYEELKRHGPLFKPELL